MKSIVASAILFILAGVSVALVIAARTEIRATAEVCQLVRDNYFRADASDVKSFLRHCETVESPLGFSRKRAIRDINARLSEIASSHLSLYSPDENRRLWENEGSDTGIRSRMIDDELVVIGTLDESPARRAKLQPGDVVVTINGEKPSSEDDARTTAGIFQIARKGDFFKTELKLEDLKDDLAPSVALARGSSVSVMVLKIPSFLPQYFENEKWLPLAHRLVAADDVIIDLRGNAGGSFPAMLRVLSTFKCEGESAGVLWRSPRPDQVATARPSVDPAAEIAMVDDLDAQKQLALFQFADRIQLKTFNGKNTRETEYPCFEGRVVVLTDNGTSSVAEIFSESFLKNSNSQVWGWPTAGQVVMARWFPVGALGGGDYAMSIPIAGYRAPGGDEIEGVGVHPERELHYDLASALRGEDSWINEAARNFSQRRTNVSK